MNLIEAIVNPFIDAGKLTFRLWGEYILGNTKREFDFDELFKSIGMKNSEGKYPIEADEPYKGKDGYSEFYFKTPIGVTLSDMNKKKEAISEFLKVNEELVEIVRENEIIVIRVEVDK